MTDEWCIMVMLQMRIQLILSSNLIANGDARSDEIVCPVLPGDQEWWFRWVEVSSIPFLKIRSILQCDHERWYCYTFYFPKVMTIEERKFCCCIKLVVWELRLLMFLLKKRGNFLIQSSHSSPQVFPGSKYTGFKPKPTVYRKVVGWLEIVCGAILIIIPGPLKASHVKHTSDPWIEWSDFVDLKRLVERGIDFAT